MIFSFLSRHKIITLLIVLVLLGASFSISHASLGIWFENGIRWSMELWFDLAAFILRLSAQLMDNFLVLSFFPVFLEQDFIKVAWSNMRDIANMSFVIGAIWIAYLVMKDDPKWKKYLINLVVVVVVINFSFFFSRVVIDAGNLLGRAMYNSVAITIENEEDYLSIASKIIVSMGGVLPEELKNKSLTGAFMAYLQPEVLTQNDSILSAETSDLRVYILTLTVLIFVFMLFAVNFFSVAFMLITRMMWLAVLVIVSPLAFITLFMPADGVLEGKDFKTWLNMLLSRSFCIAIYLGWIWLALLFLQIDFGLENQKGDGFTGMDLVFTTFSFFMIKLSMVAYLINRAKSDAGEFCEGGGGGAMGAMKAGASAAWGATKFGGRVVGRVGGNALKRRAIGGLGERLSDSKLTHKLMARETGVGALAGRLAFKKGEELQKSSGYKEYSAKRRASAIEGNQRMEKLHPEAFAKYEANKDKNKEEFSKNLKGKHVSEFASKVNQDKFNKRMNKVNEVIGNKSLSDGQKEKALVAMGGMAGDFATKLVKAKKSRVSDLVKEDFMSKHGLGAKDVLLSSSGIRKAKGGLLTRMLGPELADARAATLQLENVKTAQEKTKEGYDEDIKKEKAKQRKKVRGLDSSESGTIISKAGNIATSISESAALSGDKYVELKKADIDSLRNEFQATNQGIQTIQRLATDVSSATDPTKKKILGEQLARLVKDTTHKMSTAAKITMDEEKQKIDDATEAKVKSIERDIEKSVKDADGQIARINKGIGGSEIVTKEDLSEVGS